MIERDHPALSIRAQCRLLSISRSSFYHEPAGETEQNLGLMGLMPIYQKPNSSKPRKEHQTYPYLLGGLRVGSPRSGLVRRHHFPADASRLSLPGGDHGLKVLLWRISNTLEVDFCVEALNKAIHRFGAPGIMNKDQGAQFTSFAWTDPLKRSGTQISMGGQGRCIDNVFIERLWRSLKYECVYLHAWETGSQTKAAIGCWVTFYNQHRPHTDHGAQPPAAVYFNTIETDQQVQAAA